MFTGIIESVGKIEKITGNSFRFSHSFSEVFQIGESIAVNGMCVTITNFSQEFFEADIIEESRNRTIFGNVSEGDIVNLERSAIIGARNSGHNVSGHIDETGKILEISKQSDFWRLRIGFSSEFFKNIIFKGSIAIDGISLTVSEVSKIPENCWFEVSIIPHTWENTNLQSKKEGDLVNLEFDQVGKYSLKQKKSQEFLFDVWNDRKKKISNFSKTVHFKPGEIFYASLGKNIGSEQNGKGGDFIRPVLVVKGFNKHMFWGVPLSTTSRTGKYYFSLPSLLQKQSTALLSQLKTVDSKRLIRKIGGVSPNTLEEVKEALKKLF